ncbi:MAG: hypothetical protein AB7H80_14445, partial [Candidatus Kapaibacterium sp.]
PEGAECTSVDVRTSGSAAPTGRKLTRDELRSVGCSLAAFPTATQQNSLRERLESRLLYVRRL